ncbi:MAG: hypothetical protein M3511_00775 [Deinococcota bacterium]|jgi:PHD/YefM family antitoxin component YafN of YafNO toxin-antitoxin module|nr:hypothetical protein [Deinococcota bacterium]
MINTVEPEYIVDSQGRKVKVILAVEDYERLLEDLYDLQLAAKARAEESISWEEVKAELERDGLL